MLGIRPPHSCSGGSSWEFSLTNACNNKYGGAMSTCLFPRRSVLFPCLRKKNGTYIRGLRWKCGSYQKEIANGSSELVICSLNRFIGTLALLDCRRHSKTLSKVYCQRKLLQVHVCLFFFDEHFSWKQYSNCVFTRSRLGSTKTFTLRTPRAGSRKAAQL